MPHVVTRIDVHDIGAVQPGDTLKVGLNFGLTALPVVGVDRNRQWIDVLFGFDLELGNGWRLFPSNAPPVLYSDSNGDQALPSNVLTLDARGEAEFFTEALVYDSFAMDLGSPNLPMLDRPGGFVRTAAPGSTHAGTQVFRPL